MQIDEKKWINLLRCNEESLEVRLLETKGEFGKDPPFRRSGGSHFKKLSGTLRFGKDLRRLLSTIIMVSSEILTVSSSIKLITCPDAVDEV